VWRLLSGVFQLLVQTGVRFAGLIAQGFKLPVTPTQMRVDIFLMTEIVGDSTVDFFQL
jgi:hypothetical protein